MPSVSGRQRSSAASRSSSASCWRRSALAWPRTSRALASSCCHSFDSGRSHGDLVQLLEDAGQDRDRPGRTAGGELGARTRRVAAEPLHGGRSSAAVDVPIDRLEARGEAPAGPSGLRHRPPAARGRSGARGRSTRRASPWSYPSMAPAIRSLRRSIAASVWMLSATDSWRAGSSLSASSPRRWSAWSVACCSPRHPSRRGPPR